jgi:hypothetical protein
MRRCAASLAFCVLVEAAGAAMQPTLGPRDATDAVSIGQSRRERDRSRFHTPYRLVVSRPPVDYIEVITPFRRIVLAAESRAEIGNRAFGQRQALEMLAAEPPTVDTLVELTFHPLNTFVGVPDYAVTLVERGLPPVRPRATDRIPRHGPRVDGTLLLNPNPAPFAGSNQPLSGGTMVAHFDAQTLNGAGGYDLVIAEAGKELARARVDFSKLR